MLGTIIKRGGAWRSLAGGRGTSLSDTQRSSAVLSGSWYALRGSLDSSSPPDASVFRVEKQEDQTFVHVQRLLRTEFYAVFTTVRPPSRAGVRLPQFSV